MLLKPKPLTLQGVYASLRAIALTKGPGSAQRKQDLIKQLISRCRSEKWIMNRAIQGRQVASVCPTGGG